MEVRNIHTGPFKSCSMKFIQVDIRDFGREMLVPYLQARTWWTQNSPYLKVKLSCILWPNACEDACDAERSSGVHDSGLSAGEFAGASQCANALPGIGTIAH